MFTCVGYGSCSGCDAIKSIHEYDLLYPNRKQIKSYISLALHLIQNMKKFYDLC